MCQAVSKVGEIDLCGFSSPRYRNRAGLPSLASAAAPQIDAALEAGAELAKRAREGGRRL
jgi:hypothetical protein